MYLVNFPFFDGFCVKNGARAVCRKIGRLTKHKRGAIKTNPARSRQIQGCCLKMPAFLPKSCRQRTGAKRPGNKRQARRHQNRTGAKLENSRPLLPNPGVPPQPRWRANRAPAGFLSPLARERFSAGAPRRAPAQMRSRHLCWRVVFLHFSSSFPLRGSVLDPSARSPLALLFCRVPGSIPPAGPASLLARGFASFLLFVSSSGLGFRPLCP